MNPNSLHDRIAELQALSKERQKDQPKRVSDYIASIWSLPKADRQARINELPPHVQKPVREIVSLHEHRAMQIASVIAELPRPEDRRASLHKVNSTLVEEVKSCISGIFQARKKA